jgi:hypothetical protein
MTDPGVIRRWGFRFWRFDERGELFSPFADDPMPTDGVIHAHCYRVPWHQPPHPGCECGVALYLSAADMQRAIDMLDLFNYDHAVSIGEIEGPVLRDPRPLVWTAAAARAPMAYRVKGYKVTRILHNRDLPLTTDLPTVRGTRVELFQ